MGERDERADRGLGARDHVVVACDVGEVGPDADVTFPGQRRGQRTGLGLLGGRAPPRGPRPPAKACATADPIPPTAPVTRTPFPASPSPSRGGDAGAVTGEA